MRPIVILVALLETITPALAVDVVRPNIIFILADDLGPGDIGCYGGKNAATPNIDRLAAEGTRFTQYYAAAPICSPSRCGLVTGQFPARWRITSFLAERKRNRGAESADFLDPQAPSLPRTLQKAGYCTAHIGKWHLGGGRDVTDAPKFAAYGYDEHAGTYESPQPDPDITATDWIWSDKDKFKRWQRTQFFVDKTLEFLRRNKGTPCFVNLWLDDVHTPWVPDEAASKGKPQNDQKNLSAVAVEMDRQIGRLLAGIKELGIDDNTLVIFTSDNGPMPKLPGRTQGLRGSKLSLYEGGIRMPFIVRWPGTTPANKTDNESIIGAVDMFPTLCRIAGVEMPIGVAFDGIDRSASIKGVPTPDRPRPLMWEYGRNDEFFAYPKQPRDRSPQLAIRDGKWKLLCNADGSDIELYNLSIDRQEASNIAAANSDIVNRLKAILLEWQRSLRK